MQRQILIHIDNNYVYFSPVPAPSPVIHELSPSKESQTSTSNSAGSTAPSIFTIPVSNDPVDVVNVTLAALGQSPMNKRKARAKGYVEKKLEFSQGSLIKQLNLAAGTFVTPQKFLSKGCMRCKELFTQLSTKFHLATSNVEKYRILTTVPSNIGIQEMVNSFNCSTYMAKKASRLRTETGPLTIPKPKCVGHYEIPEKIKQEVIAFYLNPEMGRISPELRETIVVKDKETGNKIRVAKHQMLVTQKQFYNEFLERNNYSSISISLSSVAMLRPKQCKWGGSKGFIRTCVCVIHQNFELLLNALHISMKTGEFLKRVLCDPPLENCYIGMCQTCPKLQSITALSEGIDAGDEQDGNMPSSSRVSTNVQEHEEQHMSVGTGNPSILNSSSFIDQDLEEPIQYYIWHANELIVKNNTRTEIVDTIDKSVIAVSKHHFLLSKQQEFFRVLENRIKHEQSAVVQLDFAENYSFVIQDEIQGHHWTNNQLTVHPFYCTWSDDGQAVQHKAYIVISDCLSHNATVIEAFRRKFVEQFKNNHPDIKKLYYVSDGTGAQYKNYKNFINLMHHRINYGIHAEHHFTVSYHGKSQCDAMSAVVKRTLRLASLRDRVKILTATEAYDYCVNHLKNETKEFIFVTQEYVSSIEPELDVRYSTVKTIPGTQGYHSFVPLSDIEIETRTYSLSQDSKTFKFGIRSEQMPNIELKLKTLMIAGQKLPFQCLNIHHLLI